MLITACASENNNNSNSNNNSSYESSDEVLEPDVWTESDVETFKAYLISPMADQEFIDGTHEISDYTNSWTFNVTYQNNSNVAVEYYSKTYRTESGATFRFSSDVSRTVINPGDKYKMDGFCSDDMTEEEYNAAKCVEIRIETRDPNGVKSTIELEPETQTVRLNNADIDSLVGQPKNGVKLPYES